MMVAVLRSELRRTNVVSKAVHNIGVEMYTDTENVQKNVGGEVLENAYR